MRRQRKANMLCPASFGANIGQVVVKSAQCNVFHAQRAFALHDRLKILLDPFGHPEALDPID